MVALVRVAVAVWDASNATIRLDIRGEGPRRSMRKVRRSKHENVGGLALSANSTVSKEEAAAKGPIHTHTHTL